jgi:hypothetical protein
VLLDESRYRLARIHAASEKGRNGFAKMKAAAGESPRGSAPLIFGTPSSVHALDLSDWAH